MSVLSKPYFHDEAAAFDHLESVLWPEGPVCAHCGSMSGKHYDLRKTRVGLRKCSDCRKQFTVKVGTVFESAKIPLNKMLQAVYLMTASKKGVSAHQLHRILEVQYRTAWFLCHRIREAMRSGALAPMGGAGGAVEVDETYIGRNRIRQMVRRDAIGDKYSRRSALLKSANNVILEIPAAPEEHGVIEGIRQYTTIDGQLIKVGGAGDNASLQLQVLDGNIISGFTASRNLTKELAPLIYESVRLMGIGQWCRSSDGKWHLERMLVQSYEKLEDEDATITLEKLRDVKVEWPNDFWAEILREREADQ